MPLKAVSTRYCLVKRERIVWYSLVKGERIVCVVLTIWLRDLKILHLLALDCGLTTDVGTGSNTTLSIFKPLDPFISFNMFPKSYLSNSCELYQLVLMVL